MEEMWLVKLSWSSVLTVDCVGAVSEDPRLMLCCVEGHTGEIRTFFLDREIELNMLFSHPNRDFRHRQRCMLRQ